MSTHTKARNRRQWRHPASRCRSHQNDKHQGEARRKTKYVPVDAPSRPSPQRTFGALQGHEYIRDGAAWKRCAGPEDFANFLEWEARERSWYCSTTTRKGVPVEMMRSVATPIEVLTTTFSPWLSDWTAAEINAKRDPRRQLAEIRNRWLEEATRLLANERHILGYGFHADTSDLHFDLCLSRQDGKGGRVGKSGLGLVGPWCVGTSRQVQAGAVISKDKRRQLTRSVENFRRRYGDDAVPLDVALARALDAVAAAVIGPELLRYQEAYAARVPEMEQQHAAAELEELEAAAEKVRERLGMEPPPVAKPETTPEPEPKPVREIPEPNLPSL